MQRTVQITIAVLRSAKPVGNHFTSVEACDSELLVDHLDDFEVALLILNLLKSRVLV